jgi:hypothetical protein
MTGRYVKLVFYTVINRRGVLVRSHNLRFTGHITEIGQRELEVENGRLKRIVAERDLEIDAMREVLKKNW